MPADNNFRTTKWTLVVAAADADADALEELCVTYWPVLHQHVRRMGYEEADAQDLTQAFFARLLGKRLLSRANVNRGRFRTFLLTALHRFVINEWHRGEAAKRGGGHQHISLDFSTSEAGDLDVRNQRTPEAVFQREWAIRVIENAFERLRNAHESPQKRKLFDALVPCIARNHATPDYATVAANLDSTVAAVKMAASRLRKRFREMILEEIRATVAGDDEVEDELHVLFAALTRK